MIKTSNLNEETLLFEPIFPRYLFIRISLKDNWTAIKSTQGVVKIVMFGNVFSPIPDKIVESIKAKLDQKDIYKQEISQEDYKAGDKLIIEKGKFAGIEAIFLANKSKTRVRLLLKMLNTSVVSELNKVDIGSQQVIKEFSL